MSNHQNANSKRRVEIRIAHAARQAVAALDEARRLADQASQDKTLALSLDAAANEGMQVDSGNT